MSALKLLLFLFLISVFAHADGMQLLAPGVGYTMDSGRLYWTHDNGATWAQISPKSSAQIQDVFFQDLLTGWILLSQEEEDGIGFSIAITDNSGQTWSVLQIPVKQRFNELSGNGWLCFFDRMHGWLLLHGVSSSAFSWGRLLATNDGGQTWRDLSFAPVADRPIFTTIEDGWISDNLGGCAVLRTHDGGMTWQGAGPPIEKLPPTFPTRAVCEHVTFTDAKHGFLPIMLSESTDAEKGRGRALVLYATDDGGQTWNVDRSFTSHKYLENGVSVDPFGAVSLIPQPDNKVLLMMTVRDYTSRRLTIQISTREETTAISSVDAVLYEREEGGARFISQTQGWLGTSRGRLLATVDGGATWKDISPIHKSPPPVPTGRKFHLEPIGPGPNLQNPNLHK